MKTSFFTVLVAAGFVFASAIASAQDSGPDCCKAPKNEAGHSGAAQCCASDGQSAQAQSEAPRGRMGRGMHGGGQGRGAVMPDAMQLLHNYASLERTVEEIPNGVRTRTTTKDPEVLALLRRHPREMYSFYEGGGSVMPRIPLFSELAKVSDQVSMKFRDLENGIEVTVTSEDPEVVKLIRAHAAKVSEFVKRGMPALHEGGGLPEDYHPAK